MLAYANVNGVKKLSRIRNADLCKAPNHHQPAILGSFTLLRDFFPSYLLASDLPSYER